MASFEEFEMLPSVGTALFWQSADWISCDTTASPSNTASLSIDEFCTDTDFFSHIDYSCTETPLASSFSLAHAAYFVSVLNEGAVDFTVRYCDSYSNACSTGYPLLTWWHENEQPRSSIMTLTNASAGEWTYAAQVVPNETGTHYYYYTVRNPQTDEYQCAISSFVVTTRPAVCVSCSLQDGEVLSNARIMFRWTAGADSSITYRLYVGETPQTLAIMYQGGGTSFECSSLSYGKQYYWQIEARNAFGISSTSPLYSFMTITAPSRAFNYPNPFNPALNQPTNIVFDMPVTGSAEIRVYSELGDLCWERSYDNLPAGANEISYDGRDDNGNVLFNGTYLCKIIKRGGGNQLKDSCRLLIVK